MARPAGETFEELLDRFRWSPDQLGDALDRLADRRQVKRVDLRYVAAPEAAWRLPP